MRYKKCFISLYALALSLMIFLSVMQVLRYSYFDTKLALFFHTQSNIYAKDTKNLVLFCIKKLSLEQCREDFFSIDDFNIAWKIKDVKHGYFLDIAISGQTALSTKQIINTKRYFLQK